MCVVFKPSCSLWKFPLYMMKMFPLFMEIEIPSPWSQNPLLYSNHGQFNPIHISKPGSLRHSGHFIMFSVITNVYNKKIKRPTLMELFTSTGKVTFFWQLETFDVCTMGDTAHIDTIFKLLQHTRQHVDVLHTSNISSCQKKTFSVFLWLWTIPLK